MADEIAARVVGIDLGTTNSLVAFMQGDVPTIILWFRHEPQVYNSDLKHLSATPVLTTPFWNTWQYAL